MKLKEEYTKPLWWLVLINGACLLLWILGGFAYYNVLPLEGGEDIFAFRARADQSQLMVNSIVLAITLAGTVFYWKYRDRIIARKITWSYIISLLLAVVIIPVLVIVYTALSNLWERYDSTFQLVRQKYSWLLAAVGIVAHIFFILMVIDAFKKKQEETTPVAPAGQDMLNDYA